ncbi:MAG: MBL fold metallo-hydrolase [Nitratireductor sp.]
MARPPFKIEFKPNYAKPIEVGENIFRITAPNKSAFTFHGTNTYIIGKNECVVIDPGPLFEDGDDSHFRAILDTIGKRKLTHILITHTHMDHSQSANRLAKETGAIKVGEGPHRNARELHMGEINALDAAGDKSFVPDIALKHGDVLEGSEFKFEAIYTPGHATNHMCYALLGTDYIFSGDHVMGWSTSIVAPPDGSMRDYFNSLDIISKRKENTYFPGHGGVVENARDFARALKTHRKMRETAILHRIRKGDETIEQIVAVLYKDTDKRLHGAAALSVFAHLEVLVEDGFVSSDSTPSMHSKFFAG